MAFTGDLEHLHIVDIIQLVHTTRKSGIFSVKGSTGESRLVFSSGHIVSANHINSSVRIGSVLVKMGAITLDDLKRAIGVTKDAAKNRRPLLATLIEMGSLKREDALRGLKKLVEMTIVELMSWHKGTFTFDTDAISISSEMGPSYGDTEQDLSVDSQMVLMDALRIFDERERDRAAGKEVSSFEAAYADVLPDESAGEAKEEHSTITADDLGLADIDRLEKKIPRPASEMEIFNPVEIHRQKIKEILTGFTFEEQEAFVSFLRKFVDRKSAPEAAAKQENKAVVMFSDDKLITHSVMSIGKAEGIPVFVTDDEKGLEPIVSQCLSAARMPVVVFDCPGRPEGGFPEDKIISLRSRLRGKYPAVPVLQLASLRESNFILQSYHDGARAVLPKPLKEVRRETYIQDTIKFLDSFKSYIFQYRPGDTETRLKKLKEDVAALRGLVNLSDAPLLVLAAVADMCERAATFLVHPSELIGERAIGVNSEKSMGPAPAGTLKISLSKPSIFRDVLEKGQAYYGQAGDEALKELYKKIGEPLSPAVVLLPLMINQKVAAVVYGDFGGKEASTVLLDTLEILAQQAGMALEYELFRRETAKRASKIVEM